MRKNDDRKLAEMTFLSDRGRITNKELAERLGVHPATVARWKKLDEWDMKLLQSVVTPPPEDEGPDDDSYAVDLRHITQLNERIDQYLQKRELLPTEILELAQAKFHLMSCMEIVHDQLRYPYVDEFDDQDQEFE